MFIPPEIYHQIAERYGPQGKESAQPQAAQMKIADHFAIGARASDGDTVKLKPRPATTCPPPRGSRQRVAERPSAVAVG